MTETDVEVICEQIKNLKPDLVMIDSIQTMNLSELSSSPGSITQVRESANMLMRTAKGLDIPMFIVGHVNKEVQLQVQRYLNISLTPYCILKVTNR